MQFRGINHETNEYVYGWHTKLQQGTRKYDAIICYVDEVLTEYYIHNKETIAQGTGMLDNKGKEIYSNDRLRCDSIFICDLQVYYCKDLGQYRVRSVIEDLDYVGSFLDYESKLFEIV